MTNAKAQAEASPSQLAARRMAAWLRAGASIVALVVAVLSARVVIRRPVELDLQLGLVFLFWSVAPAVWFLFEYNWIWRRTGGDFEDLKYGQELAKAVWVGIATVLLTLILGHSGKATPPADSSAAGWRLTE